MFSSLKKLILGSKGKAHEQKRPMLEACADCGVRNGELHELFCTKERCPFCGGQLASCECIGSVLKLTHEQQQLVDEYIDDSIPPLSEIMHRWQEALTAKGRLPFEAHPDDPIRAAYRGDIEAVRTFLDNGIDPDAGNQVGYTALMGAARGANVDVLRLLLSRGGRATITDKRGCIALHWVVAQPGDSSQATCVRVLLDAGADINARDEGGITPLMNAAWFGCVDAVRELLQRGADPLLRENKNRSAMDLASERGHRAVEALLK
jgi:Ankyrin repeats (many copies)